MLAVALFFVLLGPAWSLESPISLVSVDTNATASAAKPTSNTTNISETAASAGGASEAPISPTPSANIASLSTWAPVKRVAVTECEKSFEISDACLKEALFIGQETADIPHNISHMNSYCEVKKENFNCIKVYGSKCLKNVPRTIYLSITKNVRKMFKQFCDTDNGKNTFLKHLECAKPEHLKIMNDVLGKLTLALEFVARNVSRDKMITYACCALYKTYDEIPSAMGGMCAPRPTPTDTIDFFRSLITRTVGEILDIGCGKFNSYSYCQENFKPGLDEIKAYLSSGRPLPDNSFMIPLMDFAQKLDGH